jgi:superfamily II DNA helicase RecQ
LPKNCWACDFCLEKKEFENDEVKDYVNISVFALVLDVVRENDARIWVGMMTKFLWWSRDAKIIDWGLDKKENFWALWDLDSDLIQAVIEALISNDYLEKTEWKYPLLWITDIWKVAINRNDFLKDDNTDLQHYIRMKLWSTKNRKKSKTEKRDKKPRWETYNETLFLFEDWKTIDEIVSIRWLKKQTIENHVLNLYSNDKIKLSDILKLTKFSNLKSIKDILNNELKDWYEWLKTIKEKCLEKWCDVTRFEISSAIAMIEKWDL